MRIDELRIVAETLVTSPKGILAADESRGTIEKRFKSVGVACTEEERRSYREGLFTTPGLGKFISGVILFDETIRQKSADGVAMPDLLKKQGIIPGIKVDKGAKNLAGFEGDKVTEGLDELRDRLLEYVALGARFTKWRAVIKIGPANPSGTCIEANAHALARFAALSQEAGLVPIVEPEVLMDGTHSIERHFEVTESVLHVVFRELFAHHIALEGMLLKPNMVLSGKEAATQAGPELVAETTVTCLRRTVPAAVPGIVFLSGGQTDRQATIHLHEINKRGNAPWQLSFSFGRALQAPALEAWRGRAANIPALQQALLHRARCNSAARSGAYTAEMERH